MLETVEPRDHECSKSGRLERDLLREAPGWQQVQVRLPEVDPTVHHALFGLA